MTDLTSAHVEARAAIEAWDSDIQGTASHVLGERLADALRALVYDALTPYPHDHAFAPYTPFGSTCLVCGVAEGSER